MADLLSHAAPHVPGTGSFTLTKTQAD
ncbi:MAG: hypothetical protein AVDCRST_MAG89-437, partial [uncultured Gemmatimonadetes bacterium]